MIRARKNFVRFALQAQCESVTRENGDRSDRITLMEPLGRDGEGDAGTPGACQHTKIGRHQDVSTNETRKKEYYFDETGDKQG